MEKETLGSLDFETDPFIAGRVPYPFACGIYFNNNNFHIFWEPNIIEKTVKLLRSLPACTLIAHNGGKFDFHYLIEESNPGKIVVRNGRVTEMQIGNVTLKDSWPLMPFALAAYQKTRIDYKKFEKNKRTKYRDEITKYLVDDCRDLLALYNGFRAVVGPKDTIGAAAFYQIRKLGIEIISANETHDDMFRPYYYGGRVQAFKTGVFHGHFKYLDINSAYSYAMLTKHPHGTDYLYGKSVSKIRGQNFYRISAISKGALPHRAEDGSLNFPNGDEMEFTVTGWELLAALDTKSVHISKVLEVWKPQNLVSFAPFVNMVFPLKAKAKANGDRISELAYKFESNAPYGKFAQNPRDFKDYILAPYGVDPNPRKEPDLWTWESDFGGLSLWWKSSYNGIGFYDVCTAASITGYVRAYWWRAYNLSKGVLYGDTDAMICESSRVRTGKGLGEWKLEGSPYLVAIGGKKLYAVRSHTPDFECHFSDCYKDHCHNPGAKNCGKYVKIASKGARLTFAEMLDLCRGKTIKWANAAPTFSLQGPHFVERNLTSTGDSEND